MPPPLARTAPYPKPRSRSMLPASMPPASWLDPWALARAWCSPAGLRAGAVESFWVGVHALLYPLGPLGVLGSDMGLEPSGASSGMPVVLVHGLGDNQSGFAVLRHALRRAGLGPVLSYDYSPAVTDLRTVATGLGKAIAEMRARAGLRDDDPIAVVGHSLGGLAARYYVQVLGGAQGVRELVTLGAPHAGTQLAFFVPHPIARQLRPGSALLRRLARPAPGIATHTTSIYSDLDQVVTPAEAGRLDHRDLAVTNVHVRGVGHWSLPVDATVVRHVVTALDGVSAPATNRR